MMAVCEVASVRQVQAQDGVARLQNRCVGGHIGLRSCMRLHVRIFGLKELFRPSARQFLDHIGELTSTVIALARIALRILVGEDGPRGFEHGLAHEVLRGNQLQAFVLTASLVVDGGGNLRVCLGQATVHGRIAHGSLRVLQAAITQLTNSSSNRRSDHDAPSSDPAPPEA